MKAKYILKMIAVGALVATPVLAHHSTAVNFNRDSIISVEGVITQYKFQNPHVQILLDVTNDDGEVEHWMAELSAKNQLVRSGWDGKEFEVGEKVKVTGSEGYRPRSMLMQSAIKADGTEITRARILTDR